MTNARAEPLADKPGFKHAFRNRRCLIPAGGYYEWTDEKGKKRAVLYSLRSGESCTFAGLYERWAGPSPGAPLHTCTIVTTEANALVAAAHDRMPMILSREKESLRLDPSGREPALLRELLRPYPAEAMQQTDAGAMARV